MKKILVLCTGNSCRSQILEAWLRHYSNGAFEVCSAGVESHGLNQDAVMYMAEYGVDISGHSSDLIDKYINVEFDLVITVCDHAKERCPIFPQVVKTLHQNFDDPSKVDIKKEEEFRRVILELKNYAKTIVEYI